MKKIIVVGASSGIGRGIASQLLESGDFVILCGRRIELMEELRIMYPETCLVRAMDVTDTAASGVLLESLFRGPGPIDWLILSSGTGDINSEFDFELEKNTLATNVSGFTAVVDHAFNLFRKQGYGQLAAITSVAGLRGGAGAPSYNASKAYQVTYLEALQIKARKLCLPIYVTDARPGFVDTAMAQGEGLFWVAPVPKASRQIIRAIEKKRRVAYITRRWRIIAFLIRWLPFRLYSKI